jgi:ribosomal protein S12 methylthiotransferase accessory factor
MNHPTATRQDNPGKTIFPGAHLLVNPSETLARVSPFMSAMGITRIANVTGLDRIGIPVVMVCRPNSRSIAVSQGKGCTLEAAKASGLMESIESWHAERIESPLKLGSFDDYSGKYRLVNVERLPALRGSVFHHARPILWIEGENLMDRGKTWVPYEMVHTYYTRPAPAGSGCFPQSSNGLASGNHHLEALSHAICEIVERDASSLWHQRDKIGRDATRLDLDSIDNGICRDLVARIRAAGLSVAVWNITSDTGIPCFECAILDRPGTFAHPGLGAGCHPDKSVALARALVEAVQVRTTYIAGSRDDLTHAEYTRAAVQERNHAFGEMSGQGEGVAEYSSISDRKFFKFREDLEWILERLRLIGIDEVVCVDLSRPQFEIPVVRVVIPGLEGPHDDDGYLPGPRAHRSAGGNQ